MPKNKYNILAEKPQDPKDSPANEENLSLAFESSLILSGTKYPEPRTRIAFNFISTCEHGVVKLFFVTVTHAKSDQEYYGLDASDNCVIVSSDKLETGKRYEIYGRLEGGTPKTLHCVEIREICYRRLCYEIF
ncbi:uncharacterized protein Eint_110880 [Encephalitozoon intestinalis ATCC 50506]|uniref:Uncharacterized protein n=1 Tax=Encephalitozoon intestinalis (strain ATCC 50506) TaxID=876142 RepID=E0SAG3_ENCIT|nr:uncharacterized protein Eint_110880 [Encephalitozoon intestinalis ATCC 50506]ADM12588.1 hypothetical protein Eint_110880 [Encephalitozoon intestinalis ATCC 50506]UTX46445.1 hypothetical protein GPK93_11g20550 [Encephalitozoon intestinalis]